MKTRVKSRLTALILWIFISAVIVTFSFMRGSNKSTNTSTEAITENSETEQSTKLNPDEYMDYINRVPEDEIKK